MRAGTARARLTLVRYARKAGLVVHESFDIEAAIRDHPLDRVRDEALERAKRNYGRGTRTGREYLRYVRLNGIRGYPIFSPRDAALTEQLRRDMGFYEKCQTTGPTDVLVPVPGRGGRDPTSRFGGPPNFRPDQPWPTSKSGEPLTFIAQLCFADSHDLVGPTPGELLLVFNRPHVFDDRPRYPHGTCYAGEEWALVWSDLQAPLTRAGEMRPLLVDRTVAHFQRWRALGFDYSDAYDQATSYEPLLNPLAKPDDFPSFADPHALGPLQGFRIGGKPFGVQDQPPFARFLCEIAGLSWEGAEYVAAGLDAAAIGLKRFAIGDAGELYVGFDGAGNLLHEDQCY